MENEVRRAIVCGGRDFHDQQCIESNLDFLHGLIPFAVIIHGAQPGADTLAGRWARFRGIPEKPFPADWNRLGSKAGPIRNQAMIDFGADVLVAFPGGIGTKRMIEQATLAGLGVITIQQAFKS